MNTQINWPKSIIAVSLMLIVLGGSLSGCDQQPKSMFEQQADSESAPKTTQIITDDSLLVTPGTTADSAVDEGSSLPAIVNVKANKLQAIANQPNCDSSEKVCQYFELNVLEFTPEQPWLTSIMWKTIAQVIAPETPLASQDQTAKNTILMLLKQVEYGDQVVSTLPLYERIDTELILHPIGTKDIHSDTVVTGYLLVRSTIELGSTHQYLNYVMLDMQKKLQLTIEDILLPQVNIDSLLISIQNAKQNWLASKGFTKDKLKSDRHNLSSPLSQQWYLDEQGLHIVYQSGELVDTYTDAVDLVVPYKLLVDIIVPSYIVQNNHS